jgi:hypothetical protein
MTTTKTTTTKPTAAETYAARSNDIARLMDVLQMELNKHAEAAKADPKNWGRTGDLGMVRERMIELVASMSGMDRDNVEAFLADAE